MPVIGGTESPNHDSERAGRVGPGRRGGADGVGGVLGAHAQDRRVGGEQAAHPVLFFGGIVVPRPEAAVTLAEIVAYLREEGIATFKLPERLEIRSELPRNPLGKILKRELRDELRR